MKGLLAEFHSVYFALILVVAILVILSHPTGAIGVGKTLFQGLTDPLFVIQGKNPPNYGKSFTTRSGGT